MQVVWCDDTMNFLRLSNCMVFSKVTHASFFKNEFTRLALNCSVHFPADIPDKRKHM